MGVELLIGALAAGSGIYAAQQQKSAQQEALRAQKQAQERAAATQSRQQQEAAALSAEQMALQERLAKEQMEAEKLLQKPPTPQEQSIQTALMSELESEETKRKRGRALSAFKTRGEGGFLGGVPLQSGFGMMTKGKRLLGE